MTSKARVLGMLMFKKDAEREEQAGRDASVLFSTARMTAVEGMALIGKTRWSMADERNWPESDLFSDRGEELEKTVCCRA